MGIFIGGFVQPGVFWESSSSSFLILLRIYSSVIEIIIPELISTIVICFVHVL